MEHGRDLEEAAEHRGGNFPSDALFLPNPLRLVFSPLGADGPRWNVTSARTILQSQKILPLTNMWLQVILLILPLWCSSAPTTDIVVEEIGKTDRPDIESVSIDLGMRKDEDHKMTTITAADLVMDDEVKTITTPSASDPENVPQSIGDFLRDPVQPQTDPSTNDAEKPEPNPTTKEPEEKVLQTTQTPQVESMMVQDPVEEGEPLSTLTSSDSNDIAKDIVTTQSPKAETGSMIETISQEPESNTISSHPHDGGNLEPNQTKKATEEKVPQITLTPQVESLMVGDPEEEAGPHSSATESDPNDIANDILTTQSPKVESGLVAETVAQDPESVTLSSHLLDKVDDDAATTMDSPEPAPSPKPVQVFDPSENPEATTFLAEANDQTESDLIDTTEATRLELDEVLVMTTEAESDQSTGATVAPSSPRQPRPSTKRSFKGYKVYRVLLPTDEAVRRILSMEEEPGVEFWADPRLLLRPRGLFVTSAADIMVAPQTVQKLEDVFRQARLTYSVLLDDVETAITKENPSGPSFARSQVNPAGSHRLTWERYHRVSDIYSFLDYLREKNVDWIQVLPMGKSSQGRPIHAIKLSRRSDEPSTKKKAILIDAGVHANEWITPATLTWMVNELVENAEADGYRCILDRFDWYFVPMVNPDGYEYSHVADRMWRKTRRNDTLHSTRARKQRVDDGNEECVGVDINANFEFNWQKGSSNPCSPNFAGRKPFSEPESRALANFMLKLRSRLSMYISLHSYSQMWLLPWGFTEARPKDFSDLYSLAKVGVKALQSVHNTSYLIGSVPDLLAVASGTSQDWAKGVAGVDYSYTVEMRDAGEKGMILPANQIIPTAEETWAGIYASAQELAHRFYPHLPSCVA